MTRRPDDADTITLDFPDVKLHHEWQKRSLPWTVFQKKRAPFDQHVTKLDPELLQALTSSVRSVSPGAAPETTRIHHSAASAFLYTLLSLADPSTPACTYTLRSAIPIASGLGSSASISVCLSAALLIQSGHIDRDHITRGSDQVRDIINAWALVGELNIHGNPSGIDNSVATLGKAVLFRRGLTSQGPSITPLPDFPTLPLLLVDTKQPRSTAVEVAKVGRVKERHHEVATCILEAIGQVTASVHSLISHESFDASHPDSITKLGELIRLNHGLLATLGVSHPRLERIRELIDHRDLGWSKLTGGGGGGCAFAVLDPGIAHDKIEQVEQTLQEEGYGRYETLLGGKGVGFLNLAKEETKEVEVTQDTIRNAKDPQAVEDHVGITASHLVDHWQFFD